jgi:hypothetical protein
MMQHVTGNRLILQIRKKLCGISSDVRAFSGGTRQTKEDAMKIFANFRWIPFGVACLWAIPAGAADLPFRGRIQGSFVAAPSANPVIYTGGANAAGVATHIGAFSKATQDATNIMTGEVQGAFTMTAPTGDQLTGVYAGYLTVGTTPGSFSWVLNATITGGTGRFSAATGKFVFIAEGQAAIVDGVVHGVYTETFDGTIMY